MCSSCTRDFNVISTPGACKHFGAVSPEVVKHLGLHANIPAAFRSCGVDCCQGAAVGRGA
eukprot:5932418-Amphidinium_carterae.1